MGGEAVFKVLMGWAGQAFPLFLTVLIIPNFHCNLHGV